MQGQTIRNNNIFRMQWAVNWVGRKMTIVAAIFLGMMMLLVSADVIGRYFFNHPFKGTYELVGLMLMVAATWGLAFSQINRGHIRIAVLFDNLPKKIRDRLDTITYSIGFATFSLLAWRIFALAVEYFRLGDAGECETLPIPYYPFIFMLFVGFGMLALILLLDFIRMLVQDKRNLGGIAVLIIVMGLVVFGWQTNDTIATLSRASIGLFGIAILLSLLFLGVNIGFALICVGFVGLAVLAGLYPALMNLALIPFRAINSFDFAVIPLFLLMSALVSEGGIAKEAYATVRVWVGHIRGGLAMATIGACGIFAACSGSSLAAAITMGKVAFPEMKRFNYDSRMAIGAIAAGGTLGILIPPSIGFIIIGILTELSIGKLFMAGIIPGLLEVIFYCITIYILCKINPNYGPPSQSTSAKEKILSLKTTWPAFSLFILILAGIYGGVFTPTEAGGIGAFCALVICIIQRKISASGFGRAFLDTANMASIIILLLVGGYVFNAFLSITRIPFIASEFIVGLGVSPYLVFAIILVFYISIGLIFDIYSVLILTVPILYPTVIALGFDPIWYGVILVRVVEIGLITPPVGLNLFGIAGTVNIPIGTLYRGVVPFLIADFCHVGILLAFPQLCTFLPNLM